MSLVYRGYECNLTAPEGYDDRLAVEGLICMCDADMGETVLNWVESLHAGACTLDLRRTTYIDAFGVGLITMANGVAAERGIAFKVIVGWGQVKRKLQRLGLTEILEIEDADP